MRSHIPINSTLGQVPFSELLKRRRQALDLTQKELAGLVGCALVTVQKYEEGKRRPSKHLVELLAQNLNLSEIERLVFLRAARQPIAATSKITNSFKHPTPPHLPMQPTPLLGREGHIDTVTTRLMSHQGRLLTLVGPPGVGKTRLAIAIADVAVQHFPDGVYFVPLGTITDVSLVIPTILATIGAQVQQPIASLARLQDFLQRKDVLLVLDNFEQFLSEASTIAVLLGECPSLYILVTSRERLNLRAELLYQVPPLTLPQAVDLFIQRAQAVHPEFSVSVENRVIIETICRRLDCLPLAIEVIAASIDLYPPPQLLLQLQSQPLDLLENGPRDLPQHQRSLRRVIEHSYSCLSSQEQRAFRMMGVFIGGFELSMAHVLGFEVADIQALLQKNLIIKVNSTETDEIRYGLLEIMRAYALEQITAHQEEAYFAHHARLFLQLAEAAIPYMFSNEQHHWLARLKDNLNNLRGAFRWLIRDNPSLALRLAGALKDFWYFCGYLDEGYSWLIQALATDNDETSSARARALLAAAQLAQHQGLHPQALQMVSTSIAMYRRLGDRWGVAESLRESGWIHYRLDKPEEALVRFRESLELFHAEDDQVKNATLLLSIVFITKPQNLNYQQTIGDVHKGLNLLRQLGDPSTLFFALQTWGRVEIQFGEHLAGIRAFEEALAVAQRSGFHRGAVGALLQLSELLLYGGEIERAYQCAVDALQLAYQIVDKVVIALAWQKQGRAQYALNRLDESLHSYQQAILVGHEIGYRQIVVHCCIGCGIIAWSEQRLNDAIHLFAVAQRNIVDMAPFLSPFVLNELEEHLTATRTMLSQRAFDKEWTVGQAWTLETAVATILAW